MAAYDLILGPILLGTVLNIWLYGIMVVQTTMYYVTFPRDNKWVKTLVAYLFIIDTLNSVFNIGLVWRYTITLFGDLQGLGQSHWLLNIEPLMTVMISSTAQAFFAWRIVILTRQAWAGWLIGFIAFVEFASGLGCTIGAFIVGEFSRFHELRVPVIFWLVSSVLTDVLIASFLCWHLHTHRTGFSKTDDIITKLIRLTMQTGLMITVWSTIDLTLYLVLPNNNLHILFQLPLCKLYTNSLMSTLNCRAGWAGTSTIGTTIDPLSTVGGQAGQNNRSTLVFRPERSKSHQTAPIQLTSTSSAQHADGIQCEENDGNDTKVVAPRDVEGLSHSRSPTAVQLAAAASGTAFSDVTSMHSRVSIDAK